MRLENLTTLELELVRAMAELMLRANGRLGINFYLVPEVKAAFFALAKATKFSGDWMDQDLHLISYWAEVEIERRGK